MHTPHSIATVALVRTRMADHGITMAEAAAGIGCGFGTLKNVLAGDTEPGPNLIAKCDAWLSVQNLPGNKTMSYRGTAYHSGPRKTSANFHPRRHSTPLRVPTVYTAAQLITAQDIAQVEGSGTDPDHRLAQYVAHVRALCQVTDDMPTERVRHLVPSIGSIIEHLADMGLTRYRTWWRPRPADKRNEPRRTVADNDGDCFA